MTERNISAAAERLVRKINQLASDSLGRLFGMADDAEITKMITEEFAAMTVANPEDDGERLATLRDNVLQHPEWDNETINEMLGMIDELM